MVGMKEFKNKHKMKAPLLGLAFVCFMLATAYGTEVELVSDTGVAQMVVSKNDHPVVGIAVQSFFCRTSTRLRVKNLIY